MHWVIQSNLVAPEDAHRLREALRRLDTPYTDVKLIPIVRQLETVPLIEGPVFVYGSTYVHRSAYDQGWWPGYVGGTRTYEEILAQYGEEMLNADVRYVPLRDLVIDTDVFVRPENDGKLFTGKVMNQAELCELRRVIEGQQGTDTVLDERVVVSQPRSIHAEHRCLVVDGQVVTSSTYRRGDRVLYDGRVDEAITRYAQLQVDRWQPELGFAIDIAETPQGLKIIEVNALSSSGLYACDLIRFADAVNRLEDKAPELLRKRTASP